MPQVAQGGESDIEWIFKDGRWVPVNKGPEPAPVRPLAPQQQVQQPKEKEQALPPSGEQALPERYAMGEEMAGLSFQNRVIKIPKDKLSAATRDIILS